MMGGIDFVQDLAVLMLAGAAAAWLCSRIGLPIVIGYIGAGMLIGPHATSIGAIGDVDRIMSLAQAGLVFLVFGIGRKLTFQGLKRLGWPLVFGAVVMAIFILAGCRWLGSLLGWPSEWSLVLGAILMASSTAVIERGLRDAQQKNTTFGRAALGITALDDVLAIGMLTVVVSIAQANGAGAAAVAGTLIRFAAIMVAMLVGALLVIPPLLRRVHNASPEAGTLLVAGVLLGMALMSAKAGFSAVPGAFLLGCVVSSTGKDESSGRMLDALCNVLGPVFFVAMGMLLDIALLIKAWPLVLGSLAAALVLRIAGGTAALLMVGHSLSDATRAAVCLAAVGEFSLIFALTGVSGGVVPESFFAGAVGLFLFTSLATPVLIRQSRGISKWIETLQPPAFAEVVGVYHDWIENLKQRGNASLAWRLTAPRVAQTSVMVLFVSGLLTSVSPFYQWTQKWLGSDWAISRMLSGLFWPLFLALIAAPLVAIWRQLEALAMICAEAVTKAHPRRARLRPVFGKLLHGALVVGVLVWFAMLAPYEALSRNGLILVAAGVVIVAAVFWRRLIRLHSRFEVELRAQLSESPFTADLSKLRGWPEHNGEMTLGEVVLRSESNAAGRRITDLPIRADYGCVIVRIERQGLLLSNPGPDTVLYPNDKLLLLGTEENLHLAEAWLNKARQEPDDSEQPPLSELSLRHLHVPSESRHLGKSLGELGIRSLFGIQVVGIERGAQAVLSPGPKESLVPGDQLLVLGTPEQVSEMAVWLSN